jgi:hypothetical protein
MLVFEQIRGRDSRGVALGNRLILLFRGASIEAELSHAKPGAGLALAESAMLRIETAREGHTTVVRIAGDLEGEGVAELERVVQEATGPLALDLSDLTHANGCGLGAIRRLENEGSELRNTPPFVELLLARSRPSPSSTPTTRPEKLPAEDK